MTAAQFRAIRARLGMTQQQLADALGVRKNSVWRYENGYTIAESIAKLVNLMEEK